MKLDKSKPYGEIFGLPGVRYTQNGVNFDVDGEAITVKAKTGKTQYALMKNEELKTLIEEKGLVWTDRKEVIQWLSTNG